MGYKKKYIIFFIICTGIGLSIPFSIYLLEKENKMKKLIQLETQKDNIDLLVRNSSNSEKQTIIIKADSIERNVVDSNLIKEELPFINQVVEKENQLFKKPFYIISVAAFGKKEQAVNHAFDLVEKKLLGNFLWIPDYQNEGKKLYKVYIGPFYSKAEAVNYHQSVKADFDGAYVQSFK